MWFFTTEEGVLKFLPSNWPGFYLRPLARGFMAAAGLAGVKQVTALLGTTLM